MSSTVITTIGSTTEIVSTETGTEISVTSAPQTVVVESTSVLIVKGDPGVPEDFFIGTDFPVGTTAPAVLFKFTEDGQFSDIVVRSN